MMTKSSSGKQLNQVCDWFLMAFMVKIIWDQDLLLDFEISLSLCVGWCSSKRINKKKKTVLEFKFFVIHSIYKFSVHFKVYSVISKRTKS